MQAANLIGKVAPKAPADARVSGEVVLKVIIGRDGRVHDIVLESGYPMLVPAAIEAVRQWVYRPTLLNGQPVEVATSVTVIFPKQ